ncbi:MAG: hypothetical protein K5686_04320 [Lachnospiraceae bacterium]|nr:hypothetical protein [Lachnospiraceae bacterium]
MTFNDFLAFKRDLLAVMDIDQSGLIKSMYQEFCLDEDNKRYFDLNENEIAELDPEKKEAVEKAISKLAGDVAQSVNNLDAEGLEEYKEKMNSHSEKLAPEDQALEIEGEAVIVDENNEEEIVNNVRGIEIDENGEKSFDDFVILENEQNAVGQADNKEFVDDFVILENEQNAVGQAENEGLNEGLIDDFEVIDDQVQNNEELNEEQLQDAADNGEIAANIEDNVNENDQLNENNAEELVNAEENNINEEQIIENNGENIDNIENHNENEVQPEENNENEDEINREENENNLENNENINENEEDAVVKNDEVKENGEKDPKLDAEEKKDETEIDELDEKQYKEEMDKLDAGLANAEELGEMNSEMKELGSALRKQNPVRDNYTINVMTALAACEKLDDNSTVSEMKAAYGKLSTECENYLSKMDNGSYKNSKNEELREMFEGIGQKAKDIFNDIDKKVWFGDNEEDSFEYDKPISRIKEELQQKKETLEEEYTKYGGRLKKKEEKEKEEDGIKDEKEHEKKEENKKEEPEKEEEPYRMAVNREGWGKEHFIYESKYSKKTNVENLIEEEKKENNKDSKRKEKPDYSKLRISRGSSFEIKGEENDVMENNKALVPKKK